MLAWLLVLHTVGVILWVTGTFGAGRSMLDDLQSSPGREPVHRALERRLLFRCAHPGMALALLAGGAALANNPSYYMGEVWMWAKLAAAGFAVLATIVLTAHSRRIAQDRGSVREKAVKVWRGLFMGAILAAIVLVFVKPL